MYKVLVHYNLSRRIFIARETLIPGHNMQLIITSNRFVQVYLSNRVLDAHYYVVNRLFDELLPNEM